MDRWLGAKVQIKLFGEWRDATIIQVAYSIGGPILICEFWDGKKQIKVGAPYQAYKMIEKGKF